MLKNTALRDQSGATLVELMIGMVVGLLVLGGVVTVMLSNQATALVKRDLDNAQESFRFAAHTITRIVRNADNILESFNEDPDDPNSPTITADNTTLIVNITRGPTLPDCLGNTTEVLDDTGDELAPAVNIFQFIDGNLLCNGEILASGLDMDRVGFTYAEIVENGWLRDSDFNEEDEVVRWNDVIAVRVQLQTTTGLGTVFIATLRERVLAEYIQ